MQYFDDRRTAVTFCRNVVDYARLLSWTVLEDALEHTYSALITDENDRDDIYMTLTAFPFGGSGAYQVQLIVHMRGRVPVIHIDPMTLRWADVFGSAPTASTIYNYVRTGVADDEDEA